MAYRSSMSSSRRFLSCPSSSRLGELFQPQAGCLQPCTGPAQEHTAPLLLRPQPRMHPCSPHNAPRPSPHLLHVSGDSPVHFISCGISEGPSAICGLSECSSKSIMLLKCHKTSTHVAMLMCLFYRHKKDTEKSSGLIKLLL